MSRSQALHLWGFIHDPRDTKVATCDSDLASAVDAVRANLVRHGHQIRNLRSTRNLEGWLVAVDFEVRTAPDVTMWHKFTELSQTWPTK